MTHPTIFSNNNHPYKNGYQQGNGARSLRIKSGGLGFLLGVVVTGSFSYFQSLQDFQHYTLQLQENLDALRNTIVNV
ncbi:hypothetical protein HMI54_000876 [Coelomomyces lativittatus]|nr:hypothetical protein HMI55_007281 [Coelomomyces lativittatus]KAJ1511362.1 hypothetical protein HMI54_000876 [Coelomomyces lativittatus]